MPHARAQAGRCSRSCALFGDQVSHWERFRTTGEILPRGKNSLPGPVWIRRSPLPLLGRPAILAGEEPADEADLVDEEEPEPRAHHSRREGQRTMKKDEAPCREGEGHGDGDGDE